MSKKINNPLDIFSQDQIDRLTRDQLRLEKKKILLKFQMTNAATVVLNGHEVDKNTVLEVFEALERDFDNLIIYQKLTGLKLLASDVGLKVFATPKQLDFSDLTADQKDGAYNKMSELVSDRLVKAIKTKEISSSGLQLITDYYRAYCPEYMQLAFGSLYRELEAFLETINEQTSSRKLISSDLVIDQQIANNIDVKLYQYLKALPEMFSAIKTQYAQWCLHEVVSPVFEKENRIQKYPRRTLEVLRRALSIASQELKLSEIQHNLRQVEKVLNNKGGGQTSSTPGCSYVLMILFILKAIFFVSKCVSQSNSRDYNRAQTERNSRIEQRVKKNSYREKTKSNKSTSIKAPEHIKVGKLRKKVKDVVLDINGRSASHLNLKLIKAAEKANGDLEIIYWTDALPTTAMRFEEVLPKKFVNKYHGKSKECVFTFKLRNYKEIETKHRVKLKVKKPTDKDWKMNTRRYAFEEVSDAKNSRRLTIKSLPRAGFKIKGLIQSYNVASGNKLRTRKFDLYYDDAEKSYMAKKSNGQKLNLDVMFLNDVDDKKLVDTLCTEAMYYAGLVRNIRKPFNKNLKLASVYTIKKFVDYTPEPGSLLPSRMEIGKAFLKYFATSHEDSKKYATINNNHSSTQYLIDYEGNFLGAQMTYIEGEEVHRVLMYLQ